MAYLTPFWSNISGKITFRVPNLFLRGYQIKPFFMASLNNISFFFIYINLVFQERAQSHKFFFRTVVPTLSFWSKKLHRKSQKEIGIFIAASAHNVIQLTLNRLCSYTNYTNINNFCYQDQDQMICFWTAIFDNKFILSMFLSIMMWNCEYQVGLWWDCKFLILIGP